MSLTDHPAYRVVTEHASALARRIAQEIVADLKAMQAPLLSGDGTPLTSVWQEICVQVQGEESSSGMPTCSRCVTLRFPDWLQCLVPSWKCFGLGPSRDGTGYGMSSMPRRMLRPAILALTTR